MTPEQFAIKRRALGLSQIALAEYLEINRRSIRRWESSSNDFPVPEGVADWINKRWDSYVERVIDVIDDAQSLGIGLPGDPITLFSYTDNELCCKRTGLSITEHQALLGHIVMALSCMDYEYEIVPVAAES